MNFASRYVFEGEEEYEDICELAYDHDLEENDLSDDTSDDDNSAPLASARSRSRKSRAAKYNWRGGRAGQAQKGASRVEEQRFKKADTNVVAIEFDANLDPGDMLQGPPVICTKCSGVFSHISNLEEQGVLEDPMWKCEYCDEVMFVRPEREQIPKTEDVTFLLSASPNMANKSDGSLLIFCLDTSGSMAENTEITPNQLKDILGYQESRAHTDVFDAIMAEDMCLTTRLQVIQAVVENQLWKMAVNHPGRRVGLIDFSSQVIVVGDGSHNVTLVNDLNDLHDTRRLRRIANGVTLPWAIGQTCDYLADKVHNLEDNGTTALGPALVVAIEMAATQPGSEVILCTDGLANEGVGNLEDDTSGEAANFYVEMAQDAAQRGVTISVITLEDARCALIHLGELAAKTGGQVKSVSCTNLNFEFESIIKDQVKASKVKSTLVLFKELYVVDNINPTNQNSRIEQSHGNVKDDNMTRTFAFAKRKEKENQKAQGIKFTNASLVTAASSDAGEEKNRPFQLHFEYIDGKGNKLLRVITRIQPVTVDRKIAENEMNIQVMATHTTQETARLAKSENYDKAIRVALSNQNLMKNYIKSDRATMEDKEIFYQVKSTMQDVLDVAEEKRTGIAKLHHATANQLSSLGTESLTSWRILHQTVVKGEEVIGDVISHTSEETADLAREGNYDMAMEMARANQRLINRYMTSNRATSEDKEIFDKMVSSMQDVVDEAKEKRKKLSEMDDKTANKLFNTLAQKSEPKRHNKREPEEIQTLRHLVSDTRQKVYGLLLREEFGEARRHVIDKMAKVRRKGDRVDEKVLKECIRQLEDQMISIEREEDRHYRQHQERYLRDEKLQCTLS